MESNSGYAPYQIIEEGGMGEIEEKKSRFIAHAAPVYSEAEALAFIEKKKKEYWDARHNCYAYIVGERGQTVRFSDDGEPAGTAGKPILEVLAGAKFRNAVVVVTRYFGGTLLGTGGLVRAYTQAAQAGLRAGKIGVMRYGYEITIVTDYNGVGKVQYLLGQRKINIEEADYAQQVMFRFYAPYEQKEAVVQEITEATAGKAALRVSDPRYYRGDGKAGAL